MRKQGVSANRFFGGAERKPSKLDEASLSIQRDIQTYRRVEGDAVCGTTELVPQQPSRTERGEWQATGEDLKGFRIFTQQCRRSPPGLEKGQEDGSQGPHNTGRLARIGW